MARALRAPRRVSPGFHAAVIILTVAASLVLTLMVGIALWNLATAPRLELAGAPLSRREVSLLVPARNEEENLRATMPALLALDYPELEILVLDDVSDDGTAALVQRYAERSPGRVRLLRGRPLPSGWLGKNWACHQLAEAAAGEVLIFCDADVTVSSDAVTRTVALMDSAEAGVLTAFPRQRFGSWTEAAVVPLVTQLPVLTMLPLSLVPRTRAPSLAVGNGQWLAFTRAAYRAAGGHAGVRGDIVEDVALARAAKRAGERLVAATARDTLEVRMYHGGPAVREGFSKNLYALVGGRSLPFAAAVAAFMLAGIYPWVGAMFGLAYAAFPLLLLTVVRLCGLRFFGSPLRSLLLHPVGAVLLLSIAFVSWRGARRGTLRWKGRGIGDGLPGAGSDVPERHGPAIINDPPTVADHTTSATPAS